MLLASYIENIFCEHTTMAMICVWTKTHITADK